MTVPNTTYRVLVEKLGAQDPAQFKGNEGEVFYDPDANPPVLKLSDGSTPGGISFAGVSSNVLTTQYVESVDADTPIDLTKSVVKLSVINAWNGYSLADGVEGQILHLVPVESSNNEYIGINIQHARWSNGNGIINESSGSGWLPFRNPSFASACVTLIFTGGYWNLPHNTFD